MSIASLEDIITASGAARVAEQAYVREGELKRERALLREERKARHQDARTQEPSQQKTPPRDR